MSSIARVWCSGLLSEQALSPVTSDETQAHDKRPLSEMDGSTASQTKSSSGPHSLGSVGREGSQRQPWASTHTPQFRHASVLHVRSSQTHCSGGQSSALGPVSGPPSALASEGCAPPSACGPSSTGAPPLSVAGWLGAPPKPPVAPPLSPLGSPATGPPLVAPLVSGLVDDPDGDGPSPLV